MSNNWATRRATRKICVCAAPSEVFCLQNVGEYATGERKKVGAPRVRGDVGRVLVTRRTSSGRLRATVL